MSFRRQSKRFYSWLTITGGVLVVMVGIIILILPTREISSLSFRLLFQGAEEMQYPNGTDFSPSRIISTGILKEVFEKNELAKFVDFEDFADAFFVTQWDLTYLALENEYRSKMAAPGIDAVERNRIEREYREKLNSGTHVEYSLSYTASGPRRIPPDLVPKIQQDILRAWSDHAVSDRGVRKYDFPVLSAKVLLAPAEVTDHPVVLIDKLRTRVVELARNVETMRELPGAEVAETREGWSLVDISLALDDVLRFETGPLLNSFRRVSAGSTDLDAIYFVESQVQHNRRERDILLERREAVMDAYRAYMSNVGPGQQQPRRGASSDVSGERGDAVMPQLDDTFLDRLLELTTASGDRPYRQSLADELKDLGLGVVVYEAELRFYEELLDELRKPKTKTQDERQSEILRVQLEATRERVRHAAEQTRQIFEGLEMDLNSSDSLYVVTQPVTSTTARPVSIMSLVVGASILFLVLVPVLAALAVLYDRVVAEVDSKSLNTEASGEENRD